MVAVCAISRLFSVWEVCWVFIEVDGFRSWYRAMRFPVMESRNGGWLRTCGRVLLFVYGVGSGDVSFLWEVNY